MSRILVVGGNGFLGAALVDALIDGGHDVRVLDRFSSPRRFRASAVREHRADLDDHAAVARAVAGVDVVFHFLSTTTPASAAREPLRDVTENLTLSVQLAGAAAAAGVERFVYASSGGTVYGPVPAEGRVDEDVPLRPISPYGIGKAAMESYLEYFRLEHGMDHRILRIGNPYGPAQMLPRPRGLIAVAMDRARRGEPFQRIGNAVRDYLHVDDLVQQVLAASLLPSAHRTFNVASGTGHSVSEVLAVVRSVTGLPLIEEVQDNEATFVERSVLDPGRILTEFGLSEPRPLAEGVRQMWEAIR
ncbi:NAD-dependent epimerase/dehydratase family protein [Zhihengliuella sp.]|uniref:NAD-dependent epimerase/dehydratase family protein n=1 Tax=Zhihengliuella sp. TaxID=1954483 RepID=UPI0028125570|nr:NAD-dependent epimerase/dehydratase family protein [Zhihengliuella sp.]